MRQRRDERQVGGGGGEVDVAARLVRLGLEGEPQAVPLVARVLAQEVDRLAEPLDRLDRDPWRRRPPRPRVRPRTRRSARPAPRPGPSPASSSASRRRGPAGSCDVNAPSLNTGSVNRLVVAIGTCHAGVVERLAEVADDAVALGGRRVDRHQVVVVEVDAAGAELRQTVDGRRPDRAADATNSPNGSRPRLPTVQRPKVNLSAGVGVYDSCCSFSPRLAAPPIRTGPRFEPAWVRRCMACLRTASKLSLPRLQCNETPGRSMVGVRWHERKAGIRVLSRVAIAIVAVAVLQPGGGADVAGKLSGRWTLNPSLSDQTGRPRRPGVAERHSRLHPASSAARGAATWRSPPRRCPASRRPKWRHSRRSQSFSRCRPR